MLPKNMQLSQRAMQFFSDEFKPRYDALLQAVSETPLVALMWGPSSDWYSQRLEIRDALVERGHQVTFREDLGIPSGLIPQRAVDLIPGHTTDVALVIQSSYTAIGEVQHFAEFRVVESRMLIFIDESAKDRRSYLPSTAQLQLLYNNVETFRSPEEIVKGKVLQMVLDKIAIFQMVKYGAQKFARRWGVNLQNYPIGARGEDLRVFPVNLLELHRAHRNEIDLLNDPTSLFLLAYIRQTQSTSFKALARDLGLVGAALQRKLTSLLTSRVILDDNGMIQITPLGIQVLEGLEMPAPAVRTERTVQRVAPPRPLFTRWVAAGASMILVALCALGIYMVSTVSRSELPAVLTPSRISTPVSTTTLPVPSVTPTVRR